MYDVCVLVMCVMVWMAMSVVITMTGLAVSMRVTMVVMRTTRKTQLEVAMGMGLDTAMHMRAVIHIKHVYIGVNMTIHMMLVCWALQH